MPSDPNTLIIMYIEGGNYDLSGIKVTLKSVRQYYTDEIVVICKDVDTALLDFLQSQNVTVRDGDEFPVLYKTSPYNNKIIYIHLFLQKYKQDYENFRVFYCDISDVYFRCNPFAIFDKVRNQFYTETKGLIFSLEDKTISECATNTYWSNICYGESITSRMGNSTVINSGLIWGDIDSIVDLYAHMIQEMTVILSRINYPTTDQIIVNKLVYIDNIACVLTSSFVNNLSQKVRNNIDNLINHQYKVYPDLQYKLYTKYE